MTNCWVRILLSLMVWKVSPSQATQRIQGNRSPGNYRKIWWRDLSSRLYDETSWSRLCLTCFSEEIKAGYWRCCISAL